MSDVTAQDHAAQIVLPPFDEVGLGEIPTPALLLDLDILERNAQGMARRCRDLGVALRPHFKTHKCLEIADLQVRAGARGLTVATLSEARALLQAGYDDLTWAFPLVLTRLDELANLVRAHPAAQLGLLLDSIESADVLDAWAADGIVGATGLRQPVWLEIDPGHHRSGVDPRSSSALDLARRLADCRHLELRGLLSHSGQAYAAPGLAALAAAAEEERSLSTDLAERLRSEGIGIEEISVGSTPGMSAVARLDGVSEARPGNYIFFDHTQVHLGACDVSECAVTVLTSVVSSQPGAEHCIVDAGALSLSKDPGPDWLPRVSYGGVFSDGVRGELDPEKRLVSLSQEHGKINARLALGTRLRLLPNHSCLTVPCFGRYVAVRGDRVAGFVPIQHRPY